MTAKKVRFPSSRSTPYGILRAAPFKGDDVLPAQVDCVIVGGGILGVTTAYMLARRGISVLVCEKAEIGCESSSRAFGWVSELLNDPAKMEMIHESKRLWGDLAGQIGETGYRRHGIYYLAEDDETAGIHEAWYEGVKGVASADTRLLSSAETAAFLPAGSRIFKNALHAPSDAGVEPILVTAAIAEAARAAGAHIVTDCAVRGLDLAGGAVAGVFTEKGYVKTSTALCAANVWSRLFCGNLGVDIPQLYAIMSMGRTAPIGGPEGAGGPLGWAFRKQIDGGYALGGVREIQVPLTRDAFQLRKQFAASQEHAPPIKLLYGKLAWDDFRRARRWNPRKTSPFEKNRVIGGEPSQGYADATLDEVKAAFPMMESASIVERWAGPLTITPDDMPIAGSVDAIPGFHVLTGCSFGITWAPALGKMMADIMTGALTSIDATPFRLDRFASTR